MVQEGFKRVAGPRSLARRYRRALQVHEMGGKS
jgi:hypothetical protein